MRASRPLTALAPLAPLAPMVLLAGLVTGCDSAAEVSGSGPDPDATVAALATALSSGSFADVALSDGDPTEVAREWQAIVAGMGAVEPAVTAGDVEVDGDSATATYSWSWPLGAQDWTYETTADLTRVDDEWQVVWDPAEVEPSLRPDVVLAATTVAARRGGITGRGGAPIVSDRPVVRFGIDREKVPTPDAGDSARRLARLVDIDAAAYAQRVEAAGPRAFVEAIVYRRGDAPAGVASYARIPGAVALPDEVPLAPTREFAAPILGTVGDVTAEMIQDDPETYRVGDQAGLSGLEARYDEQLRGTPGVVVDAVGSDGKEREVFRVDATDGEPLALTLDVDLQQTAERLLAGIGPASALVAIKPSTDDLLVAANGPGTDGYNIATYGQLAPGSTFKSVSSLALLRSGLTPDSVVPCDRSITVDGKTFTNYSDYPASALGRIPFRTALANSCNTAFISQAGRLGNGDLAGAAASLGLGIDHDLGFPAYFGSVAPPSSETEAAADLIGQGAILASPMVMAAVIGSVQQGAAVVPRLITSLDVEEQDATALTGEEATRLRSLLRGVVTGGSGRGLLDVPGPPVIAKTGTAEFERKGTVLTHAWMIAAQGDLAVAAFVDVGESGSGTAGPILEAFLRAAR